MEYTQKVVYQSNYWYNDGLKKAKIRDMTGAVTSLKKSLQFNSEILRQGISSVWSITAEEKWGKHWLNGS